MPIHTLTTRPSWKATTLDRPSRQDEYARFTPDVLAKAARMLLDWPDGFHKIAAEVRETAKDRAGHYGVRKELGPLVALGMDANLQPGVQRLIKHRITLDMGITSGVANTVRRAEHRFSSTFIPIQQAAQEYGVTRRAISRLVKRKSVRAMKVSDAVKAPVLVDSQQLAEMIGTRIFGVPSQSVAVDLGIPRACLRSLADAGFLVRLEPGPLAHRSGDYYLKDSVDALRRRCEMMAVDGPRPAGCVRITKAMNRLGLGDANPWPEVVAGILGGEIKIWRVEGRLTALMTCHAVKDLRELALNVFPGGQRVDDDVVFTQVEAADFLKTTSVRVNGLVRLGLLCPQPTVINLKEFAAKFVLTAEVSEQFASKGRKLRWRDVPTLLRASGVEPVASLNGKVGLLWRRSEVDSIIAREGAQAVN